MLRAALRRHLRLLSLSAVLAGAAAAPAAAQAPGDIRGDVDADGAVTAADALAVLSSLVETPLPQGYRLDVFADADGNGRMTAADALVILSSVVGKDVGDLPVGRAITDWVRLDSGTVVVDSTAAVVLPDPADPTGTMRLHFAGTAPAIGPGTVLLGTSGGGFLRRVTQVQTHADTLVLATTTASLEEAIQAGTMRTTLSFSPGSDSTSSTTPSLVFGAPVTAYMAPGMAASSTGGFNFSGLEITAPDAPFSVKITEGTYQVDASVDLDATWARGALQYAHLIVRAPTRSALALEASYKVNATAAVQPWKDTIFESRRPFAGSIGFVPVAGYVSIMLEAEVSSAIEGTVAVTGGVRESSVLQAGARYRNGAIEPVYSYQPTRTVIPVDIAGKGSSQISVTLKPVIAVRFYGMVGPFVETPAFVKFEQEIAASLNGNGGTWKQVVMAGVDARIGGSFDVFTSRVGQLSWNFEGPRWMLYADSGTFFRDSIAITPDTVEALTMGDTLRLRAAVWDHMKRLQPGARVSWRSGSQHLSVDTTGLVRTVAEGPGIIIAEYDGAADTAHIPVALPSVATDVDTLEITAGGYTPARVIARALDARSREIPGSRVEWRSGRWDYVAVDSLGNVTGLQEGYASVEAWYAPPDGQYAVVKVVPVIIRGPRLVIGDAQGVPFPGDTVPTLTTGYIDGRLTATAYDHGNQPIAGARFSWSSNNASTVAVDSTGRVTGRDEGGTNIIVTLFARDLPQPVARGEILVHTRLPTVRISPDVNVPVLTAGFDTLQLTATAFDAHGQPLPGAGFRWSSNDTQTLTVDSTGLVRSTHFAGGTYIVATTWRPDGTAPGVRAEVLVTSGLPTVEILQDSVPLLTTGMDTYQLSARAFDVLGREIPGARFRWSVNDETTLVVDSTGFVKTAWHASTGLVIVTLRAADGTGGLATDEILARSELPTVVVSPKNPPVLTAGGTGIQLTATVYDARGQVRQVPVTWSSVPDVYARVSSTGYVTPLAAKHQWEQGSAEVGAAFLSETGRGLASDRVLIGIKAPPPP